MNWAALEDLINIAEHGSLSAAARQSGVSQPTLGRRIEQLEQDLGTTLFVRSARGLSLTPTGEKILKLAEQMQQHAHGIERIASGASQILEGTVRVTLTDSMGNKWLPSHLSEFHQRYPGLKIDVVVDNRSLDLIKREADIAIRFSRPRQLDLVVRELGKLNYGMYGAKRYLEKHGTPKSLKELRSHYFISYDEMLYQYDELKRIEQLFGKNRVIHRSSSNMGVQEAIRNGLGLGVTACYFSNNNPELVRIMPNKLTDGFPIWVATHEEIYKSARIRAVFDFLCEKLTADADKLIGEKPDD